MTEHPITPPPKLVEKWIKSARYKDFMPYPEGYEQYEQRLTTIAARWGSDQELEACCAWVQRDYPNIGGENLRAARRPKPPSLKEQALEAQQRIWNSGGTHADWQLIRRALEALPDD
jgi:hypothetical protein